MGMEEGEEIQTKDIDNLFNNIAAENFPNHEKGRDIQVQEAFRTPNRHDQKKRHDQKMKTLCIQNKERMLKLKNKCNVTCKSKPIRIKAGFLTQILNAKMVWKDIFLTLKENNC
jgi:hypothetical protein